MQTYKIVRMFFKGKSKIILRGLTLEQAQFHCKQDYIHGKGWFDGYESEG